MSRSFANRFFAAVVSLAIVGAACTPAAPTPTQTTSAVQPTQQLQRPSPDFQIRIGIGALPGTMDPHASIINNSRRWGLYECLIEQDENGKIIPSLATAWKSVNPTTWHFTLAPNRKFQAGNPVTAQDVKYSFDRSLDASLKLGVTVRLPTVDHAEVVDAQTLAIVTKQPDPLLLKRVAIVNIVEKAFVDRVGPQGFSTQAMGTGPYMQKEFVGSDRLVLVPNPYHPKPGYASQITVRQISETSARIAGIRTGELDLIGGVSADQVDLLKTNGFNIVNFSQGNVSGAFIFTLVEGPTQSALVRQALNYAIDKNAIATNVYKGYAKPTGQVVNATTFGYNPSVAPYPFDPAKAKQLLAQAGYSNGFKLRATILNSGAETQAIWVIIQSNFRDVGIELELNLLTDYGLFTDQFYGRSKRDPILLATLLNSPAMDSDYAFTWFRGNEPEPAKRYANPEFDKVYLASTSEMDEAKRLDLLRKANAIIHDDAPFLFLFDGVGLWASSSKIENVIARTDVEPRIDIVSPKR